MIDWYEEAVKDVVNCSQDGVKGVANQVLVRLQELTQTDAYFFLLLDAFNDSTIQGLLYDALRDFAKEFMPNTTDPDLYEAGKNAGYFLKSVFDL